MTAEDVLMQSELLIVDDEKVAFVGAACAVPRPDLNAEPWEKARRLGQPVVLHGFGANDEGGFLRLPSRTQPGDPRQSLECFAEAHVIGQDTAELIGGEVGKEMEA